MLRFAAKVFAIVFLVMLVAATVVAADQTMGPPSPAQPDGGGPAIFPPAPPAPPAPPHPRPAPPTTRRPTDSTPPVPISLPSASPRPEGR